MSGSTASPVTVTVTCHTSDSCVNDVTPCKVPKIRVNLTGAAPMGADVVLRRTYPVCRVLPKAVANCRNCLDRHRAPRRPGRSSQENAGVSGGGTVRHAGSATWEKSARRQQHEVVAM